MRALSFRGQIRVEMITATLVADERDPDLEFEFKGELVSLSQLLGKVPWNELPVGNRDVEVFGSKYRITVRCGEQDNLRAITITPIRPLLARPLSVLRSQAPKVLRDEAKEEDAIRDEDLIQVTQICLWKFVWMSNLMYSDDGIAFVEQMYERANSSKQSKRPVPVCV